MAEAVGIAAGVINIVGHAAEVLAILSRSAKERATVATIKLEIEIYTTILQESGQIALSGTSTLPQSAALSLQLCEIHLSNLQRKISFVLDANQSVIRKKSAAEAWDELTRDLKDYRRSVKILRDIVTDAVTQELLIKNANERTTRAQHAGPTINSIIDTTQGTEMVEQQIKTLTQELVAMFSSGDVETRGLTINTVFTDRGASEDAPSEDVLASLRRAAEGINVPSRSAQNTSNPFEFYAKILRTQDHSEEGPEVCAKLDTGSEDNWISASIVARARLQDLVEPTTQEKLYTGADGGLFRPTGTLCISWTRNAIKSWQTNFLVLDNAPFDMLLGRRFIIDEGLFVFADPVLVTDLTRLAPLSKEDYHQMEQNLRERGVQNEELLMTREAKDAAARQRRRAEKAASRMSLTTTPGSLTPSPFRPTSSMQSQAASTDNGAVDGNTSRA